MRRVLQVISWVSLVGVILPPTLFLFDGLSLSATKWWMLAATAVWFISTPLWMGRATPSVADEVQGNGQKVG